MSTDAQTADVTTGEDQPQKMNLDVKINTVSSCERKIEITIPQEDVQRYFDKAIGDMVPLAVVPGFRAGKAPRKLVESRFRKEAAEQVKGQLLMDSIAQATDSEKLAAISEPDFDVESITVPDSGPMKFEFRLEVRPEFDMPEWKRP